MPMDIEFLVNDTYALTRPQWKLASDLEEAGRLFGEAVAQNYKFQDTNRSTEPDDEGESSSSEDELEDEAMNEVDEDQSSSEEAEVLTHNASIVATLLMGFRLALTTPIMMPNPNPNRKRKRSKLLSHDRKKNAILRLKLNLTVLLRK